MNMTAESININDYVKSGEGANGSSYDCKSDSSVMVKLYNTDYPVQPIYDELEVARKVYDLGVPSPEPGTLVTDGERLGIRFRRIVGKRSFSRILADEPERTEELAREFARMCRQLHDIECPEGMFPKAKDQYIGLAGKVVGLTEEQRNKVVDFIGSLPDNTTALHGDMHVGNLIQADGKNYFIDLGYFAQGFPLIDLGMTYSICIASEDAFVEHDFHVKKSQLRDRFWPAFTDEYFFSRTLGDSPYAKYIDPANMTESIKPYYCIKSLLIGYNIGQMLPESVRAIDEF